MDHVLTGDEHIIFDGMPTGYLLRDFWAWSSSDLLNNTLRGAYAEFIVSTALGLDLDSPQTDWTPYDVSYPLDRKTGIRIEVKSAAYLQAWEQQRLSRIQFTIRPTKAWSPVDGYDGEIRRQSDVYVFCLYTETNRKKADPLLLDKWEFYVLPTPLITEKCGSQRSISLPALLELHPYKVDYDGIEEAVISSYRFPDITPP